MELFSRFELPPSVVAEGVEEDVGESSHSLKRSSRHSAKQTRHHHHRPSSSSFAAVTTTLTRQDALARVLLVDWARVRLRASLVETATETAYIQRQRALVHRTLLRWIARHRSGRRFNRSSSSSRKCTQVTGARLDWVVPALLQANERVASAAFEFVCSLITPGNRQDLFSLLSWIAMQQTTQQRGLAVSYLCKVLDGDAALLASARGNAALLSCVCETELEREVERFVQTEATAFGDASALRAYLEFTLKVFHPKLDIFLSIALLEGASFAAADFAQELREAYLRARRRSASCERRTLIELCRRLEVGNALVATSLCFALRSVRTALEAAAAAATHAGEENTASATQASGGGGPISIHLIRAPTQEEYFRASLRDPVLSLRCINDNNHPTVGELIAKIAAELDTDAELLELVACNKILKPTLDLHQVYERVWRPLIRQAASANASRQRSASSGAEEMEDEDFEEEDFDDELMPIVYRIVAIDGEATEDVLSELPPLNNATATPQQQPVPAPAPPAPGFPQTKELEGAGLAALVHALNVCAQWPQQGRMTDLGHDLALAVIQLLKLCVEECARELVSNGTIPALLACLFAAPTSPMAKASLALLESICAKSELESAQYLDDVIPRLDELERAGHGSSLARLLPKLTAQKSAGVAMLIRRLPSAWLESVLFECNEEENHPFLRACFEGGIAHQCMEEILTKQGSDEGGDHHLRSLKLLKGLARESQSAALICHTPAVLAELVRIEEIPNAKIALVGDLAGAILEMLSAGPHAALVAAQQRARREEVQALSTKKRKNKERAQLRKQQKMTPQPQLQFDGIQPEEDSRDTVLKCCVCYEGYVAKPNEALGVYVYSKPVSSTTTVAMSTTSCFVTIHGSCHDLAFAMERELRGAKDEWEGAQIRNGHAACNNLLPLRPGNGTGAAVSALDGMQRKYLDRLASIAYGSVMDLVIKDLRLLLLRISFEESLVSHTRGGAGSIESNLQLIVPWLQLVNSALSNKTTSSESMSRDADMQLVTLAVLSKCQKQEHEEEDDWTTQRQASFKAFMRWAEQTNIHGSGLVPNSAAGLVTGRQKPWFVFFGLVDFILNAKHFTRTGDVYTHLTNAGEMAALARRLLALSSPQDFTKELGLG